MTALRSWLDGIIQNTRYAARGLRRSPGFTLTAIATLAIGIGVNAAVFTVTNAVLFKGFPHVDPSNRILYIGTRAGVSYPDFEDWRAQAKSFRALAVVANGGLRLILNDRSGVPETCDGTQLSANSFQVLGQRPILGRDFEASDETPGASAVAILTYGFWERRYAKDASIVGKTIRLNGSPTTVIGVMRPGFDFPHHRVDLWLPLVPTPNLQKRQTRVLWFAFGRMADGGTIRSAQAEMDTIGRRLESSYPLTNRGVHPHVMNFHEFFIGPNAAALYGAIWGAVGLVLFIACANLANLLLGRAIGRFREISVRIALGAGRGRIIRQLLVESVMLSSLGGLFGWLIAIGSVRTYELFASPPSSYDHWDYALDYRVFFYLVAISLATGLLFGLAPAIRLSKLDVNTTLKDGGRGTTGGGSRKSLSALLVIGEMAIAVVLLAGAGLMIRSFLKIYTADLGVRTLNILTASVDLPVTRYPGAQAQIAFFELLTTRLKGIPGVDSVALANALPGLYAPRLPFELAGAPPTAVEEGEQHNPTLFAVAISPDYFRTLGAAVLSGREFNDFDGVSGVPVVIVNQRFASRFWPEGEDPLGQRLRLFDGKTADTWRTVVGVASNIVQNDTTSQSFDPVVYVPYRQRPVAFTTVVARTRVPPGSLGSAFRREIHAMDSELVIGSGLGSIEGPKPLTESLAFNHWSNGVNAALFLIFAAIALLLASVGLYAVIAHSVGQRTQEMGVRTALGATARDILKLVFLEGMLPVGIGLTIGLAASLAVNQVLKSQLVQVSPTDPITLIVASASLIFSATLGCLIPARRAMRVDPVVALRHE
jgi:putative ABC transport system permease protein